MKYLISLLLILLFGTLSGCAGSFDQTGWDYHRVNLSYKIKGANGGANPVQTITDNTLGARTGEVPPLPTGRLDIASLVKGFEAGELEGMQIRLHVAEKNSGQMKTYTLTREQVLTQEHIILEDVPVGDVTLRLELRTSNNEIIEFDQKGLNVTPGELKPAELVIERKKGGGSHSLVNTQTGVGILPVADTTGVAGTRNSAGDFGIKLNPVLTETADNYLTIKWTGPAVLGLKGYRLLQDGKVISELHPFSVFTYSGLTPSTHYKLGVQAVFATGLTPWEPVEGDTLTPGARSGGGGGSGSGPAAPADPPPIIHTSKATPHPVLGVSNVTRLIADASDNTPLLDSAYTWSCEGSCGTFSQTMGKSVIWRAPATAGGPYTLKITVTDNVNPPVSKTFPVTVVAGNATTTAITPGALKWTYNMGAASRGVSLDADGTIFFAAGNKLTALNPDGTVKWQIVAPANISGVPAITANGLLIVGGNTGRVYAFDKNNGNLVWTFDATPTSTNFNSQGASIDSVDGTIYIGSQNSRLHAINPDGTSKWVYLAGDQAPQIPMIGPDRTIYIPFRATARLHAVNPDGTNKWQYASPGWIYSGVAIGGDNIIFGGDTSFGCCAARFFALYPNGTVKWVNNTVGWQYYASPVIGLDGSLYIGGEDSKIYAFNQADGTVKWTYTVGNWAESGLAVGSDGIVYTGSEDKKIYALNPDGTLQWEFITGSAVRSIPAISKSGVVYMTSFDNKLYALYASSNGLADTTAPVSRMRHYGMEKSP